MLVSRLARNRLSQVSQTREFAAEVLDKNHQYMELGSLGPDLPYYESMVKGAMDLLLKRSDKPMGVDQWSYQMHSKDPNVFPLKMLEITWKETAIDVQAWDDEDRRKFAFACGYLTHMAADQIIHPLVNLIAGPYYKRGDAREKHRECEIWQDVFMFKSLRATLGVSSFEDEKFASWCDLNTGFGANAPIPLRYLIQKAFVETHAVMPAEESIEDWVDGMLTVLRAISSIGPYQNAIKGMTSGSSLYKEYIEFALPAKASDDTRTAYKRLAGHDYTYLFERAVELATIYVRAAHFLYESDEIDDDLRRDLLSVVRNADLSAPLEKGILDSAKGALRQALKRQVDDLNRRIAGLRNTDPRKRALQARRDGCAADTP
jgi:hypothetical protein